MAVFGSFLSGPNQGRPEDTLPQYTESQPLDTLPSSKTEPEAPEGTTTSTETASAADSAEDNVDLERGQKRVARRCSRFGKGMALGITLFFVVLFFLGLVGAVFWTSSYFYSRGTSQ